MTDNYFIGTKDSPYHLSVGAIVYSERREICCHYFDDIFNLKDFYMLMRETLELGESVEQAVARGLMEEFGMVAPIETFLGSSVSPISLGENVSPDNAKVTAEKTTIYFLCRHLSNDDNLRSEDDPESSSVLKWVEPGQLISKMKEQATRLRHPNLDESAIVERAVWFLDKK